MHRRAYIWEGSYWGQEAKNAENILEIKQFYGGVKENELMHISLN